MRENMLLDVLLYWCLFWTRDGKAGHPWHCYWWSEWWRRKVALLENCHSVYRPLTKKQTKIPHGGGVSTSTLFVCGGGEWGYLLWVHTFSYLLSLNINYCRLLPMCMYFHSLFKKITFKQYFISET